MPSRRPRIPRRPTRLGSPGRGSTLATAAVSSFPFGPPTTTRAPVLRGAVLLGAPAGARLRWRRRGRRRCSPLWGGQVVLPRSPPPPFPSLLRPPCCGALRASAGCAAPGRGRRCFPVPPLASLLFAGPELRGAGSRGRAGLAVARGAGSVVSGARGRVGWGVKDRGQVVQGVKVGGQVVPDDKDQGHVVQDAKDGGPGVK